MTDRGTLFASDTQEETRECIVHHLPAIYKNVDGHKFYQCRKCLEEND